MNNINVSPRVFKNRAGDTARPYLVDTAVDLVFQHQLRRMCVTVRGLIDFVGGLKTRRRAFRFTSGGVSVRSPPIEWFSSSSTATGQGSLEGIAAGSNLVVER